MADELVPAERQANLTTGKIHGPDGKFIRTIETATRDAQAAEMRSRSMSYRAIAKALDVSVASAHEMVQRALAEIVRESAEAVIANELAKLDYLEQRALKILETEHITVSQGRVMYDDSGGKILDDGPALAAIGQLRQLSESRRKLIGADAAQKIDASAQVKFTYEGVNTDDV